MSLFPALSASANAETTRTSDGGAYRRGLEALPVAEDGIRFHFATQLWKWPLQQGRPVIQEGNP